MEGGNTTGMSKQSHPQSGVYPVPVLLTRPMPQATRFGSAVSARFGTHVRSIITPIMRPVFLSAILPNKPYSAVLFTSEVAVEAARLLSKAGHVFPSDAICVGAQTARAAMAEGYKAQSANGDADALLAYIIAAGITGPLLHLHGRDTRGDLGERLNLAGIETVSVSVYQQIPQPLSAEALETLREEGPVILPLFSPRSATLLARALPANRKARVLIAAMSTAVGDAAAPIRPQEMRCAEHPDAEAMLDTIQRLLFTARGS